MSGSAQDRLFSLPWDEQVTQGHFPIRMPDSIDLAAAGVPYPEASPWPAQKPV